MKRKPAPYVTARSATRDYSAKAVCTHWAGCEGSPLPGRRYCAKHAAQIDELGERYRSAAARNDARVTRVRITKEERSG